MFLKIWTPSVLLLEQWKKTQKSKFRVCVNLCLVRRLKTFFEIWMKFSIMSLEIEILLNILKIWIISPKKALLNRLEISSVKRFWGNKYNWIETETFLNQSWSALNVWDFHPGFDASFSKPVFSKAFYGIFASFSQCLNCSFSKTFPPKEAFLKHWCSFVLFPRYLKNIQGKFSFQMEQVLPEVCQLHWCSKKILAKIFSRFGKICENPKFLVLTRRMQFWQRCRKIFARRPKIFHQKSENSYETIVFLKKIFSVKKFL